MPDFGALREWLGHAHVGGVEADLFAEPQWFELLTLYGWGTPQTETVLWGLAPLGTDTRLCVPMRLETAGLHSLSNYYSCGYAPIVVGEPAVVADSALWRAWGDALRRWPPAAVLRLQPMDPAHPMWAAMQQGLRDSGYWVDRFFCFGNWYLPCRGWRFEDYLRSRSSPLRHNVARGERRLQRAGTWGVEICAGDTERLGACLQDFEAVYQASWKRAEAHPEFIRQLAHWLAREGSLRLGVLRLNGQALAAQLWWVRGGRACIYKLAYREDAAVYSAGSVLSAALFRQALDGDHVHEIDYLSGDDRYKRDWMSERRERWGVVAFDPRRSGGLWAALRHFMGRAAHRLRLRVRQGGAPAP